MLNPKDLIMPEKIMVGDDEPDSESYEQRVINKNKK
jgi:hypothetical protein